MTDEQKVVYIQAMVVCAQIEMEGMKAANSHRLSLGQSIAYGEDAFNEIANKYGIHHNAVITTFGQP